MYNSISNPENGPGNNNFLLQLDHFHKLWVKLFIQCRYINVN